MKPFAKLRGRIVEKFGTQRNFSEKVGLSEARIIQKLAGKASFSMDDIVKWSRLLEIPLDEIGLYFFAERI